MRMLSKVLQIGRIADEGDGRTYESQGLGKPDRGRTEVSMWRKERRSGLWLSVVEDRVVPWQ